MFYIKGLLWFFKSQIGHLSIYIEKPLRYTPFNNIGSKSNKIMSPARRASLINHCTQQQSASTVLSEKSSHFNTNHPLPSAIYSIPKWNHKRSRQPLGIDKSNQKSSPIWLENGNSLAQPFSPAALEIIKVMKEAAAVVTTISFLAIFISFVLGQYVNWKMGRQFRPAVERRRKKLGHK